jgi:hypothetical protein
VGHSEVLEHVEEPEGKVDEIQEAAGEVEQIPETRERCGDAPVHLVGQRPAHHIHMFSWEDRLVVDGRFSGDQAHIQEVLADRPREVGGHRTAGACSARWVELFKDLQLRNGGRGVLPAAS